MSTPAAKFQDGDRVYFQALDVNHRTGEQRFAKGFRDDRGTITDDGFAVVWDREGADDIDPETGKITTNEGFARAFRWREGDQYEPVGQDRPGVGVYE